MDRLGASASGQALHSPSTVCDSINYVCWLVQTDCVAVRWVCCLLTPCDPRTHVLQKTRKWFTCTILFYHSCKRNSVRMSMNSQSQSMLVLAVTRPISISPTIQERTKYLPQPSRLQALAVIADRLDQIPCSLTKFTWRICVSNCR